MDLTYLYAVATFLGAAFAQGSALTGLFARVAPRRISGARPRKVTPPLSLSADAPSTRARELLRASCLDKTRDASEPT